MVLIWIFYLSKLSLMNIYDGTRGVHQRKEIHVLSPEKKMVLQYTVLLKWKNYAEKNTNVLWWISDGCLNRSTF